MIREITVGKVERVPHSAAREVLRQAKHSRTILSMTMGYAVRREINPRKSGAMTSTVEIDSDRLFPNIVEQAIVRRSDGFAGMSALGDLVVAIRVSIRAACENAGHRAQETLWAR